MSFELQALIADRNETPVLVAVQDATHDAIELYRFADGTEVIVTNAGGNPKYKVGDIVEDRLGWQEYAIGGGPTLRKVDPSLAPVSTANGVLGMPAWVAQRLWLGTLLFAAGMGMRYLLRTLGVRGPGVPVAMLAYLVAIQLVARRYVRWHFPALTLLRALLAATSGLLLAWAAESLSSSGPVQLALGAITGGIVYLAALRLLGEHLAPRLAP